MGNSSEVERTKALFKDAIRTFAEPATTYSEEAAGAVVVEAVRLYRRALQAQTNPALDHADRTGRAVTE